jgi:hypothetical protein
MFCIARFECVWTSLFCSFLVQFVARKWRKVVNHLFKIITCIVLGCQPASTMPGRSAWSFCGHLCCFEVAVAVPSNGTTIAHRLWCGGRKLFISFSFWFVCIFYDGISNAPFDTSCCSTILFDMHAVEELYKMERTKVSDAKKNNRYRTTIHNTAQTLTQRLGTNNSNEQCAHRLSAGCAMACANDI